MAEKVATVDEYIGSLPDDVRTIAEAVRSTLRFPLRQPMPYDLIERVFARHVARRQS